MANRTPGGLNPAPYRALAIVAKFKFEVESDVKVKITLTGSGTSMTERADEDPISTPALLRRLAADYLAGADPETPLASPLFASLSGLPPLLVQVGTADLLLSDAERLAEKATAAGVDVRLEVGAGLPHVYPLALGTPEAAQATERAGKFLRARAQAASAGTAGSNGAGGAGTISRTGSTMSK